MNGTTPVHKNLMKYKITDEKNRFADRTLYRIQALKDFSDVKSGDLGGWVESENNLSQEGDCWVSGDAWVFGDAWVYGNARVYGDAWVSGHVWVSGNAVVSGHARVSGNANTYPIPCPPEKSEVPEFNFSTLPNEVSEAVIAGVRYKKETTWKKI